MTVFDNFDNVLIINREAFRKGCLWLRKIEVCPLNVTFKLELPGAWICDRVLGRPWV